MVLIERERELDRLEAALRNGTAGRGSTILIEGAPGIGKSTLLDRTRHLAGGLGMEVLSATAAEFESGLGFAVVRSLLDMPLIAAEERTAVLDGAATLALGPLGRRDSHEVALDPSAAIHGLYWLCANLADRRPLLLTVDDLHWADEQSLLFLGYLARRTTEHPLVICATTRPIAREPAERYLAVVADSSDEVITLRPLSVDGVARLVDEAFTVPAALEFREACRRLTGGNPYLLVEMLTALSQDGVDPTAREAERLDELGSAQLSRTLTSRILRHGPEEKRVARAVAILGPDADFRRAAVLSDLDTDTVLSAVSALRREGILAPDGAIAFAHPLIRAAIHTDIAEPERGVGHLRAARTLDADGLRDRAASHLLVAACSGDPWVVELLRRSAADACANGAPGSAAAMLSRALAEPAPEDERLALRLELGRSLARSGDLDGAKAALEQALQDVDDPSVRAGIALELGRVHRLGGRTSEAFTVLDQAVRALPAGHHQEEIALESEIAFASHMGRSTTEWIDRFAATVARADGASVTDRMARCFYAYVSGSAGRGTAVEVGRLARSAVESADDTDPPLLLQVAGVAMAMSGAHVYSLDLLDRAIETAQQAGDRVQFGFVSLSRTMMAYRAGRILEMEADAAAGLPVALDGFLDLPYAAAGFALALIERGRAAEASAFLERHSLGSTTDLDSAAAASLLMVRGRLHLALGRPAESVADLERCRAVVMKAGVAAPAFMECRTYLALAYLATGDRESAHDVAAEDLALTRAFGAPRELGMALRVSGLTHGGDQGLELLAKSVDVLGASEAELEYAKSLVEFGAAMRRAGQRPAAQAHLKQGLDVATRCGGLDTAVRAQDELVAAGARPRRDRLTGPESLTASELRVARMAADGRTNPEIAQALFVTRRTVEVHLTHAYRKLGIGSRDALAAALAEQPPKD